jgi:hypothetical protein
MNAIRLCALATLPLALAACGGGDDAAETGSDTTAAVASMDSATTATTPAAPQAPDSAMAGAQGVASAVMMNEVGSSGLTGQAQFMEHGQGQTMVTVTLNGHGSGPRSGHIHQGTCDSPGQVVAPLQDVTLANGTGTASTTVSVAYADVVNGQHVVAYHTGAGESHGPPAACGQIPAQQTGGSTGPAM